MRYNKKGGANASEETGATVLSVLIIIIVIAGAASFLMWGPPKLYQYLPQNIFGSHNLNVTGPERIRYVITEDKVQVYANGEKWTDLTKGNNMINEKNINRDEQLMAFRNFYYGQKREIIGVPMGTKGSSAILSPFSFNELSKGKVIIDLSIVGEKAKYEYILEANNNLIPPKSAGSFISRWFLGDPRKKDNEIVAGEDTLRATAIKWRDVPIENKIMTVIFADKYGQKQSVKVCPKKFDQIYIVAYLDDKITGDIC